jgi:hypothetical protein
MTEDRHLLKRLRCGDSDALRAIYEKYKDDLLTVAVSLWADVHQAGFIPDSAFLLFRLFQFFDFRQVLDCVQAEDLQESLRRSIKHRSA